MFQDILDKIIEKTEELHYDLNKNIIEFDELLMEDLYDYNNISIENIDKIKNQFISDITYYIEYSKLINLYDNEQNNINQISDEEQLVNILNNQSYDIFKLKRLYPKDIQEYLIKIDKEIKDALFELFTQYDAWNNNYTNYIIKEFINDIKNKDIEDNINICINKNDDNNLEDLKNILSKLFDDIKCIKNIDYKFIDDSQNTWNENILIFKITDKKTYEYRYIYFDLFERPEKTENNIIIKLSKNNLCFNKNYKYIKNEEINDIKLFIQNI